MYIIVTCDATKLSTASNGTCMCLGRSRLRPLKAKQQEALEVFVSGRDIFVALPTGYGLANPTVIYAILPSVYDKIRGIYSKNCNVYIVSGCASMSFITCDV